MAEYYQVEICGMAEFANCPDCAALDGVYIMGPMQQIHIHEINRRFLNRVSAARPNDTDRLRRMSLIEESTPKHVYMTYLAIVGSHSINGVSAMHSELIKTALVPDFADLWPERFNNKTNGIGFTARSSKGGKRLFPQYCATGTVAPPRSPNT